MCSPDWPLGNGFMYHFFKFFFAYLYFLSFLVYWKYISIKCIEKLRVICSGSCKTQQQKFDVIFCLCFLFCSSLVFCRCCKVTSFVSLCDPIDDSPPGSSLPGILQARILFSESDTKDRSNKWLVNILFCACPDRPFTPKAVVFIYSGDPKKHRKENTMFQKDAMI